MVVKRNDSPWRSPRLILIDLNLSRVKTRTMGHLLCPPRRKGMMRPRRRRTSPVSLETTLVMLRRPRLHTPRLPMKRLMTRKQPNMTFKLRTRRRPRCRLKRLDRISSSNMQRIKARRLPRSLKRKRPSLKPILLELYKLRAP